MHRHAAGRERQRDPSRSHAKLKRPPAAGQLRQEVDDRFYRAGLVDAVVIVVAGRYLCPEMPVLVRHALDRTAPAGR